MGIATLLMCLIPFYGIKIHIKEVNEGYLSIDNANSIKGIFVLAVFIAHTSQYVSIGGGGYLRFPTICLMTGLLNALLLHFCFVQVTEY